MPESLTDKMARFASMGNDKPKVERVFEMPVKPEPIRKSKGTLMDMLDQVDIKQIGRVR